MSLRAGIQHPTQYHAHYDLVPISKLNEKGRYRASIQYPTQYHAHYDLVPISKLNEKGRYRASIQYPTSILKTFFTGT